MGNFSSSIPLSLDGWTLRESSQNLMGTQYYLFSHEDQTMEVYLSKGTNGMYQLTVDTPPTQTTTAGTLDFVQQFLQKRWAKHS